MVSPLLRDVCFAADMMSFDARDVGAAQRSGLTVIADHKNNLSIQLTSPLSKTIVNATTITNVIVILNFFDKSAFELYIIRNINKGKNLAV